MISPETQAIISSIRMKIMEGTATIEDMQRGVALMREGRITASTSSESSRRKKAIKEIPKADDLLDELGDLT